MSNSYFKLFNEAKKEGLIVLHHDAVTGTCYPYVLEDYKKRLVQSETKLNDALSHMYLDLLELNYWHSKQNEYFDSDIDDELFSDILEQLSVKAEIVRIFNT